MEFRRTVPLAAPSLFSLTEPRSDWQDTLSPAMPTAVSTFSATLNSSLLSDLKRFADEPEGAELLAVVAAGVRHARPLALQLSLRNELVHLSIFPREQLMHCAVDLCALAPLELSRLRLVYVEPGPTLEHSAADGTTPHGGPLGPLLWMLAMHGQRSELLPEIAGPVKYRLAPGTTVQHLPVDGLLLPLLHRLWCESSSLEDLARSTPLGPTKVRRLLNALYLQSGLMISRAFSTKSRSADQGGRTMR